MLGVGAAGCWPRTWTALLRLDRASALGPSESAFQVVQRQAGGPTAAGWSGCRGCFLCCCGCLGRRRTRGQRRARLGCGVGSSSKMYQPMGQGGRVGDQRPWHAQQTSAVGRQPGAKVSRIGVNTPPRPAGALRLVGIMRIWREASGGGSSFVPNLDTSPGPLAPPTELDRHMYRTRWLYRPNSANAPSNRKSPVTVLGRVSMGRWRNGGPCAAAASARSFGVSRLFAFRSVRAGVLSLQILDTLRPRHKDSAQ